VKWRRSKAINLALQGGGAHGAFTWGVLDRRLEHDGITIKSVSATSSGAMNAVMLAYGLADGGPCRPGHRPDPRRAC
jgi:NTE family protein